MKYDSIGTLTYSEVMGNPDRGLPPLELKSDDQITRDQLLGRVVGAYCHPEFNTATAGYFNADSIYAPKSKADAKAQVAAEICRRCNLIEVCQSRIDDETPLSALRELGNKRIVVGAILHSKTDQSSRARPMASSPRSNKDIKSLVDRMIEQGPAMRRTSTLEVQTLSDIRGGSH